ncbi:hypothetical protein [Undibacter mobilis]|uniref:Capsule polysaccharide biosynthesis protein n=1 Tax=Undibacter mobilis TaxID=2292256 RepID=A0A371B6E1_9BRAD|nr:hypothetical protein [Undibacter mobilis]RDV03140.1 hypothetical protein DXH78_00175 [Undibacter mobilis]
MNAAAKFIGRVRSRFAVGRLVRRWRRTLAHLRGSSAPAPRKTVLFCDLLTMTATAKVESLFAGLLRLKGYRAIVLLEKPDWPIEAIFRAAVPDVTFVYRSTGIGAADLDEARRNAEAIMASHADLQAIVELEIDGFRIGRNVQSWALRKLRVGRLDNNSPEHRAITLDTLVQSLATKAFVQRLLNEHRPDTAIFIERGYTPAGEVFDGCALAGVDIIQWLGAPQSDCLIYKRYDAMSRGAHPLSLSDETWRLIESMPWTAENDEAMVNTIAGNYRSGAWYNRQQLQLDKDLLAVGEVRRTLGLDPAKKTAIIFCHILYDATFFYGESLFEDYEQWTVETVRAAIANPNLNWIVKVHPVNVWRSKMDGRPLVQLEAETLRKAFGVLPPHVKIMPADTSINTFSLFDVADYGLTVRGTIGMELPCFGIPVVTAGTGRYSGRGFTIDPATRDDYVALLSRLQDVPRLDADAVRSARLHYYGALKLRPIPMQSFTLRYESLLDHDEEQVTLAQSADRSLLQTPDLGRLVNWINDERTAELLAETPTR